MGLTRPRPWSRLEKSRSRSRNFETRPAPTDLGFRVPAQSLLICLLSFSVVPASTHLPPSPLHTKLKFELILLKIKVVGNSTGIFVPGLRAATNLQICEVGRRFKSATCDLRPVDQSFVGESATSFSAKKLSRSQVAGRRLQVADLDFADTLLFGHKSVTVDLSTCSISSLKWRSLNR